MNNYNTIIDKLERFIKKYYTNELFKGIIFFFAIGLLYFLLIVFLEWALWLGPMARTILFWTFIVVEVALFARFIIYPLTKLFKFSKGITYEEASVIIGRHFMEVNDKLLNVLQLKRSNDSSELLLASIDQKAEELQPIQFNFAVNFKDNAKYLKYLAIPVLIIFAIWISGSSSLFSDSYDRVVNYKQAYEPPAPFQFIVTNEGLNAKENQDFTVEVKTNGSIIPQETTIHYNGETYFMKLISAGVFQFTFNQINEPTSFFLSANEVNSRPYTISVTRVPTLLGFNMAMDYPAYTERRDEVLEGTGSASIPEGTSITWDLVTQSTSKVEMILRDTTQAFVSDQNEFKLEKRILENLEYRVSTSNNDLENYENLDYRIRVIKDQHPELVLKSEIDSIDNQSMYFFGSASDDYGLSKLELVYHPSDNETQVNKLDIDIKKGTFDEFVFAFPDTIALPKGVSYDFFFRLFDNDGVNGAKSVKSQVFNYRKRTDKELENQLFNNQQEAITGMQKSLEKLKSMDVELDELNKLQKEKERLNFSDNKKIEDFLKRQKQQKQLMQQYSKKMKENLQGFQQDEPDKDPVKEQLEERFQRNEEQLRKNERLLEELQNINDKIDKEELTEKLERLAKQNKNDQKNLEQLLELTKRYYVEKKALKIAQDLEELARKQEELSKKDSDENNVEKQDELRNEFEERQKDLDKLQEDNKQLKEPMSIAREKDKEEAIKSEQEDASDKLKEEAQEQNKDEKNIKKKSAQEKQKRAADKLKELSKKLAAQMEQSGKEAITEDVEMLRQILDNLVTFSFEQESLMSEFQRIEQNNPGFAKKLKRQSVLRENFTHIDDSLYALALRSPEIGDVVNEKLTDIGFNLNKSLERLSENYLPQGTASQQYTLTGANELAFLLAQALDNMQSSMNGGEGNGSSGKGAKGKGQGKGKGLQLPDIIKKQEELGEEFKNGMQPSQKQGDKEGQTGESGKANKGSNDGDGGENEGQNNKSKGSEGQALDEQMSGELYEIYQRQQKLRRQLEDKIRQEGLGADAQRLAKEMEQLEQSLLEKGFDNQVLQQMNNIKHQLLKLEEAVLEQGQDNKRNATTNKKTFNNPTNGQLEKAREYFNTTEILNRQSLPLQQVYKQKVQEYFRNDD